MINISDLYDSLREGGVISKNSLKGCSKSEIQNLEKFFGQPFPVIYKEFLGLIGKEAGNFLSGTDISYKYLKSLQKEAKELLEENRLDVGCLTNAFVFAMHQGYEILFFYVTDGDDPPVYQYVEGNDRAIKAWDSFSDYLKNMANQYIIYYKNSKHSLD
jgi:hypothetical protein